MNSRVYPTYKTKYCVANCASYDRALVGRGDPYSPSEQWVRAAKNIRYAHKPAFEKWKSTAQTELKNQVPHARIRQTLMQKSLLRRTPSYLVAPVASGPAVVASEAFRKWILTGNRRYGNPIDAAA